jgi:hypothetical protein
LYKSRSKYGFGDIPFPDRTMPFASGLYDREVFNNLYNS